MAASADQRFAIAAITVEEQLRGGLAEVAARSDPMRQVGACHRLVDLVRFFAAWHIVPFDDSAARVSILLRKQRPRMASMGLKIAATTLANDALLLTANKKDFAQTPGLRMENWLE